MALEIVLSTRPPAVSSLERETKWEREVGEVNGKKPTSNDVAALAGVSQTSVSLILSGSA